MSGDSFRISKCISLPQNITEVPSGATPEKQGIKLIQSSKDMLIITLGYVLLSLDFYLVCYNFCCQILRIMTIGILLWDSVTPMPGIFILF